MLTWWQQRPLAGELGQQEGDALVLVPLLVGAQAQVRGDGVDRLRVLAALLPAVQRHQAHAERRHLQGHAGSCNVTMTDCCLPVHDIADGYQAPTARVLSCRRS
jgi:hypothetical protein